MKIEEKLLVWYNKNKRNLPWRNHATEYQIYVSEIMLQQTRVETVIPYYYNFIKQFENFLSLATADEEKLLKCWEGLGYYSRVKNMKKCAIEIVTKYHGKFPHDYKEMKKLPGIGEYSAGSILSIAHDLPYAAVDGNVLRIYTRLFEINEEIKSPSLRRKIKNQIEENIPLSSGDFNQALMDLGATICLPKKPLCPSCPLREDCRAYAHQNVNSFPIKAKEMTKREENRIVLIIQRKDNKFLLRKRNERGLLANLYEPYHEMSDSIHDTLSHLNLLNYQKDVQYIGQHKHIFSHLIWHLNAYYIQIDDYPCKANERFVTKEELLSTYALPNAFLFFYKQFIYR